MSTSHLAIKNENRKPNIFGYKQWMRVLNKMSKSRDARVFAFFRKVGGEESDPNK